MLEKYSLDTYLTLTLSKARHINGIVRKRRDSNPRAAFATYTLSRGASSANLSTFPMAPQVGLEPTTDRLTADSSTTELLWINKMERVMGIEPTTSAWKAEVLPLNYTR